MELPPLPPTRIPTHQRVFLTLGALLVLLLLVDGRRGFVLGSLADRGDVQTQAASARGSAVYVWGGGGYQGGK